MKILIIGAAGMVGKKLTTKILEHKAHVNQSPELILYDIVKTPKPVTDIPIKVLSGNISELGESLKLASEKPDIIYHLASIVSGEAEENFSKGWETNAHGTWRLLEELRTINEASEGDYRPKIIFTSSIAVFGPPFPNKIHDDFLCAPQTSYGAQKAMTEMLISDYSRKGFIDGISIRLPTICVRPGKPNLAASSFFSGIIREPLNNMEALLPVSEKVRHWHASPRSATHFLTYAGKMDLAQLGSRRSLNMPGVSCTVEEQIEALRQIAGSDVVSKIKRVSNPKIVKIVDGWPRNFNPLRAMSLGFKSESSFEEIIKVYLADDFEK
jgi:nucleoside-diphosphate-sugar epimerase